MSQQHQPAAGGNAFQNVFERPARAEGGAGDIGVAPTPKNGSRGPQSEAPGLSPLKAARLKRKLVKMLGLKRHATVADVLACVRKNAVISRTVVPAQPGTSGELRSALGLQGEGEPTPAELLQLLAGLQAVPRGLADAAQEPALPLSEPLQALRDAAGQRGPGTAG